MTKKDNQKENQINPEIVVKKIEKERSDDHTIRGLTEEIRKLNQAIETLKQKHFYRYATHPLRLFGLAFLKGLITGMAAIIGATALAALFIYLVGHMAILPDWLRDSLNNILEIVKSTR